MDPGQVLWTVPYPLYPQSIFFSFCKIFIFNFLQFFFVLLTWGPMGAESRKCYSNFNLIWLVMAFPRPVHDVKIKQREPSDPSQYHTSWLFDISEPGKGSMICHNHEMFPS